ncbi:PD-(D/E)XK nuclease family transposase [Roseburia hominis]
MTGRLKEYFPIIRERGEVLEEIGKRKDLEAVYESWTLEQREEFLDFCTGARGVKMLYDSFFKEILNPESTPERLEDLVSEVFGRRVRILQVLPNDSVRLADEGSLLITDIIAEMEDGSVINFEVQKIGYKFPGQRCACYSADMLLRQYKRVKSRKKKKFSYKDIRGVYTIVLFEKSTKEFQEYRDKYIHHFRQKSDTGLELPLLQEFYLIPLDIFKECYHNKGIRSRLDAWLAFLCMDTPEVIEEVIKAYPEFRELYEQVYEICRNIEEVMTMFSKELLELDRNTVQYMIDEMQDEIDEQKGTIDKQKGTIGKLTDIVDEQKGTIDKQKGTIGNLTNRVDAQKGTIDELQETIDALKKQIQELKQAE